MAADVVALQGYINDELLRTLGLPIGGRLRRWLRPVFAAPTRGFAEIAASFERVAAAEGFPAVARSHLPRFVQRLDTSGKREIPTEGLLITTSKHPGTLDSVVLATEVERKDLKIIAAGGQFLRGLPVASRNLIHISDEIGERVGGLRQALRHLRQGGALLIFSSGIIDPDLELMPGADQELGSWSASLEIICQRVPELQVVVTIVSGVLARCWLDHPLTRIYCDRLSRQKLAEYLQVMQIIVSPGKLMLVPRVSFNPSLPASEIVSEPGEALRRLEEWARQLLRRHMGYVVWQDGWFA